MANDNFFEQDQDEQEVEKIRLGEKEYTQEELQKLVGLGEIGLEAEQKYKTRLDRVWPQFQKTITEKQELERKLNERQAEEAQRAAQQQPQQPNQPLTPEQIRAEAIKQAEAWGMGPQAIQKTVMEMIQGERLLNEINGVIDEMTGDGLPDTTSEELIAHMQETGIRNPEKAYKDMFEKEWIASQAAKINQLKQPGMPTISQSTAGQTRQPPTVKITSENFDELFKAALLGDQAN